MNKKKKPDNVVFDEETQQYTASLKPYATDVGAPAITTTDTVAWKNRNIHAVNKQISAKYLELKAEYDAMMDQFEYNNLVYSAKFNFEPVIGYTYHLYRNKNEEAFLSVIAPHECNFDYLGTFKLNADKMWEQLKD
ncbi:DUF2452 domain-containing protein [Maribacter algarum]|uniref:DUF2452 domain-containing protein n=1 Tax=Maribacter algarum (ex Zhang et al. 2020) TaxID=2578118 RepID=A0A5S3PWF7_9FLAO|nr:DUF2452 domain-containing protein [Maribacter algarum]TMM59325.1 DUF2452 domain-containing protein [Maribacter algarum]